MVSQTCLTTLSGWMLCGMKLDLPGDPRSASVKRGATIVVVMDAIPHFFHHVTSGPGIAMNSSGVSSRPTLIGRFSCDAARNR